LISAQRNRVAAIDTEERRMLTGQVHGLATPENDQGRAESSLDLRSMTLVLKPSAQQQADLDAFLARQQDPSSPDYHRWLTPEQYADRFGFSADDLSRIATWLESQNLTVISVGRGRNAILFSGPVRQVEKAFRTEIHRYKVNGELHFANSTDPSIPAALTGLVTAIHGLNDFRPQARLVRKATSNYTSGVTGNHYLAPDDVAAIYDVEPLYNSGVDGAGQKIAIVGQSRINLDDIRQFRAAYNLPASDPEIIGVPGLPDPGIVNGDADESHLDVEWSGAVARKASIVFIYSQDVTDAVHYAIDQNLAPVLSMSYGLCESLTASADLNSLRTYAQQGVAQGITWLAASGDNGGADCYDGTRRAITTASVDAPASVPEVTGVGGTEFNEGSGTYWNASNSSSLASAQGYIPEMVWNDSGLANTPASGGGGASAVFSKPSWQTGAGVPNDNARDVPDVSFNSSADHDGYWVFSSGSRAVFGGTSVATPVFAGMVALMNQYQMVNGFQAAPGQGNINPQLYLMAQNSPSAFHDVVVGDNIVTPCANPRTCTAAPVGNKAGVAYDTASGLGSLDAFNFVTAWHLKGTNRPAVSLNLASSAARIPVSGSAVLTATVSAGSGTPSGTVTFSFGGVSLGSATLAGAKAALSVNGSALAVGDLSISAVYSGDNTFSPAASSIGLTVLPSTALTITGAVNAASFQQVYAPGMILAIFGSGLAGDTLSTPLVPLLTQFNHVAVTVNGYLCPIYFISPGQINVQIPYEVPVGSATLNVSYNGQSATLPLLISKAAPGVFADSTGAPVPNQTAKRGDTITLYVTGEGAASPAPTTGNTPIAAAVPKPLQAVTVSVGGAVAATPFVGIPSWAIGLTQVNYTIPATAPLGKQQIVVSVGGVAAAPVGLVITE